MLLLESIGLELDHKMPYESNSFAHSEEVDLDFELCFTEHDDADAWSGVSLEKWCDYQQEITLNDDDWDHVEDITFLEFDADDLSDEQTIHVCPEDDHAPKTPIALAGESSASDFISVQRCTLADLLVDIIFIGIR